MTRSKGDMTSPRCLLALLTTLSCIAFSRGGPLGPLPNVTSSDVGLKEGSCALGDVVYMPGDEFPGSGPCERCTCAAGGVRCAQQQCEPRPGCKALHRPDHCCPTYQCECEQEGRVYGNGEKLVDPHDPCRVCYCQGGEVVCRRIACFVRDDCSPRLVPGRCCPEYDNCPIRGVTSLPGMTPAPSLTPVKPAETVPSPPKENEPKFTIKEITPVSEIPIMTDVKIKEILPSPSNEVADYSSSKSPLITREATSEKTSNPEQTQSEVDSPSVVEIHSTETASPEVKPTHDSKGDDSLPSRISLSTPDSINSEIYPSNAPIVVTMGVAPTINNVQAPVSTATKAPVMEEEDPSLFVDHNPAFPPLPDDLSVLSSHGDELIPEPSPDTDHIPVDHAPTPEVIIASVTPSPEAESKELETSKTTPKYFVDTSVTTTEKTPEITTETSTVKVEVTSTIAPVVKENPTVKLRSAIPTETLRVSSEEARTSQEVVTMTNEPSSTVTSTTTPAPIVTSTTIASTTVMSTTTDAKESESAIVLTTSVNEPSSTSIVIPESSKSIEDMSIEVPKKIEEHITEEPEAPKRMNSATEESPMPKASEEYTTDEPEVLIEKVSFFTTTSSPDSDTTVKITESSTSQQSSTTSQEQTTNSIAKSNVPTEVTSQTELSSLPIETSDQNPHEASENVSKEADTSSVDPLTTTDKFSSSSSEVITVSRSNENGAIDNVETTEFILTSFGSSETATDAADVELIKIAGDPDKSAAIIDHSDGNKNALTDLIKLVKVVASMSDHTEPPVTAYPFAPTSTVESEELIPVNAGYKSKNSNFNQNSITEVPSFKSKSGAPANKQRVVEIEDDEDDGITDSPPPNDKVEPTTRRPIIDNVSDDMPEVATEKKDIEFIPQPYVPTFNRRPTKVVLQEKSPEEAPTPAGPAATGAGETAAGAGAELTTAAPQ